MSNCCKLRFPHIGHIEIVPDSKKKRIDVIMKLKDAIFKENLKDKESTEYKRLRIKVVVNVSYMADYFAIMPVMILYLKWRLSLLLEYVFVTKHFRQLCKFCADNFHGLSGLTEMVRGYRLFQNIFPRVGKFGGLNTSSYF